MTALASGALPWRDGMRLDDYLDAVDFRSDGPPPAEEWVEELAARRAAATLQGFC